MEFVCLGWPPDAPTLRLNYRRFAYAGKFVLGTTGKAVVRNRTGGEGSGDGEGSRHGDDEGDADDEVDGVSHDGETDADDVLAAASFSPDRTDADRLCVRYVTVRSDRRGDGLGSRLLAFVVARADERGYDRVRIAVNNPAAYGAAYRAGFAFSGRETGLAELVCERPASHPAARDAARYRAGLDRFRERDLDDATAARLDEARATGPPAVVDPPEGGGGYDCGGRSRTEGGHDCGGRSRTEGGHDCGGEHRGDRPGADAEPGR